MLYKIFKIFLGKRKTLYYSPMPAGTTHIEAASDVIYDDYDAADNACRHLNNSN